VRIVGRLSNASEENSDSTQRSQGASVIVDDIHKIYGAGRVEALRGIALHIESGAFVSITGPSGSGKSTLLRILASLDQPTTGSVIVDGVDTRQLSGDALAAFRREHVGLIFQGFRLLPALSVLENVMAPLLPYRSSKKLREQAWTMLSRVGMESRARHLPGELSGGEQQRVAIARALIAHPHLLLADEPTGSLDTVTSHAVMDLLQELQADGAMTLIVVTHDPKVASRAQYIVKMEDGVIIDSIDSMNGT